MGRRVSPNLLLICFSLLLPIFASCSCECGGASTRRVATEKDANHGGNRKVKGMFVFGSSLVDNGNNNFLPKSKSKADYWPYGMDFRCGVTGRFTNGKNVIDLLGEHLQLSHYIPPFTNPSTKGKIILHGVNFASGGSGILDDTGSLAVQVIGLEKQIKNFEEVTLPDLETLGCRSRESILEEYIFVVGTGGNDYSFNYFLGQHKNVSVEAFTANLIRLLSAQLKKLYGFGARKFVLVSLNPLGCYPYIKVFQPQQKGCSKGQNAAAHLFNTQLKSLVDVLKPDMPGSNLVYVNSYKVVRDMIRNSTAYGFNDFSHPCCETALPEEGGNGIFCKMGGSTCENRSGHVFFDGLHPTEAVNVLIARNAYSSNLKTEVYPMNVKQLAQL